MRYIKQIGLLFVCLILFIALGYLISFLPLIWINIGMISVVTLLIIIIIGNIIGMQKIKKLMTKDLRKLKSMYDESHLKGYDTIEDIQKLLSKNQHLTNTYLSFITIVLLLLPAFLFALRIHYPGLQVPLIVLMIFYISMTSELFSSQNDRYGYPMDEQNFPKHHQILRQAKTMLGINSTVKLYGVANNNATIDYSNRKHHITLGLHLIQALNEQELLTIFLHELAHLIHEDSLSTKRWYRSIEWLDKLSQSGSVNIITQFLFQAMAIYSRFQFELCKQLSSKFIEIRADETVFNQGMNQTYISAGLKIQYYETFLLQPFILPNLALTETPSETHFEDIHQAFLDYLKSNKTIVDALIPKELDRKRQTHPTLHQRMLRFDVTSFDIEPMGPYDLAELQKLLKVLNPLTPNGKADYDYAYQYIYKPALEVVENFVQNPSDEQMTLYRYILSLYDTGQAEAYMKTTDVYIQLYGGTGYIHYVRGTILLNHYHDPKGIDEIYRAIELSPKFMEELDVIGYASIRLGLQDRLDEFKSKLIEMVEHAFKIGLYTTKNKRKLVKIEPFRYDEPIMNYLLDTIQGDNLAYSAFLFKEVYADGLQMNHLILTANLEDHERFGLGIQKVKIALSLDNEMYQLSTQMSPYYFKRIHHIVQPFYTKE